MTKASCWKCGESGARPQCGRCGALQPLPPGLSHFEVFDLPPSYFVEPDALERRFRELSRLVHPDRWLRRDPKEKRFALEWTTAVNGAYRALREPFSRASCLLKAQGVDLEKEPAASAHGLDPAFLEEVLELREALAEAKAAGDLARVRALAAQVASERAKTENTLGELFRRLEDSGDRSALAELLAAARALKYHLRFGEEAQAIELAALDPRVK